MDSGLGVDFSDMRGKNGRSGPSLPAEFRKLGPRALALELGALPRALAFVDQHRPVHAAADGHADDNFGFTETIGGVNLDVRVKLAADLSAEFAVTETKNGRGISTRYLLPSGGLKGFASLPCPDQNGVVYASDTLRGAVITEVLDRGHVVGYYHLSFAHNTKMRGQVASDAKLDTVDLNNTVQLAERVGGPESAIGQAYAEAKIKQHTVIDMRTGQYVPDQSSVTGEAQLSGLLRLFEKTFTTGALARLKKAADDGFAKTVDDATKNYRELEKGWNTPNTCAHLKFTPESDTITLKPGSSGVFSGEIAAKEGGFASGKWTLTNQTGAIFSQPTAQGKNLLFGYDVPAVGPDLAGASFDVTSKAGRAAGNWTQPVGSNAIQTISGNFSSESRIPTMAGDSVLSVTGSVGYRRSSPSALGGANGTFALIGGGYTVTASGIDSTLATACHQTGTAHFGLDGGSFSANGTGPGFVAPYDYSFTASKSGTPTMQITRSNCPPGAESMEGTTAIIPVSNFFGPGDSHSSTDGVNFADSETSSAGGGSSSFTWALQGSTKPRS
jgi:hypothetical protein